MASTQDTDSAGQFPREQLVVEENGFSDENITYPTGLKLWLTMASLCIAYFLNGLDLTIVAVVVPSLTDQFTTVSDIGWYSAAYFGKAYTIFSIKSVFIFGLVTFEAGSLLCTFAPSSKAFIVGRAVAGLGSSAVGGGLLKLLRHLFPLPKQALMVGLVGACQAVGLVSVPMVGGALTDALSWRACFGINLPLGILCIALTADCFHTPVPNLDIALPLKEKLKRIDLLGTLVVVPITTCFLMALQWGERKMDGKIRYRQGDNATVPLRVLKQRSILRGMWYSGCCNGILAMTEYYISIYFQDVRGFTATKSGLLGLPMIVGLAVASIAGTADTTVIGYYFPFLFVTSILAPIASGLLTTLDLNGSAVKAAALLGFLGVAVGMSIQSPVVAVQTVLAPKDVSLGGAIIFFGSGMGSALWICASATLFQNCLVDKVEKYSPATNGTALESVGFSETRNYIGSERLRNALTGYNEAVVQTLCMPMALGILTISGAFAIREAIHQEETDLEVHA